MSNSSSRQPIPGQPLGATFKVAAGILSAFLLIQLLMVVWYFLPNLQQAIVARVATPSSPSSAEPAPQIQQFPQVQEQPAQTAPDLQQQPAEPSQETYERISKLVSESDKAFRIGDYDLGITKILDADQLLPNDPGIMLRIARLYEKTGKIPDAVTLYRQVLALPDLPPELRTQTERKLNIIKTSETSTQTPTVTAPEQGADMRDEIGLQPGSILGIVDTRLSDGTQGTKVLRISIKARPNQEIDSKKMRVHVFFYDRDSAGNVQLTDSRVITEWISPPVNWRDNEPELLNATYTPPNAADPANAGMSFVGYVVGIYYNDELQDTRADPGSLASEHPLPLYLQSGE
jgi:hypothetical protein